LKIGVFSSEMIFSFIFEIIFERFASVSVLKGYVGGKNATEVHDELK